MSRGDFLAVQSPGSDSVFTAAHPLLSFLVTMLPFRGTAGRVALYRKAMPVRGDLGVQYAGWGCATSRALARGELPPYITRAIPRPILMAQLL